MTLVVATIMLCRFKMGTQRQRRKPQTAFVWKTWGGRRPGAGRKPRPENVGLQTHGARPRFAKHVPVHLTMRAVRSVPSMRAELVARVVVGELARASAPLGTRGGFRVLHWSVQENHVHLLAEADDATALSRGMQRLASRIAMAVNSLVGRHGRFWRERYHRRDLASPRQYRNALVYVVFNFRKHARGAERVARARMLDGCSSAIWLDDWRDDAFRQRVRAARAGPPPVASPATWTARVGWKRFGRLDPRESPVAPA